MTGTEEWFKSFGMDIAPAEDPKEDKVDES